MDRNSQHATSAINEMISYYGHIFNGVKFIHIYIYIYIKPFSANKTDTIKSAYPTTPRD